MAAFTLESVALRCASGYDAVQQFGAQMDQFGNSALGARAPGVTECQVMPSAAQPPRSATDSARVVRICDVTVAFLILLFLAPLMALVACAVLVSDGGPMIYAHRRLGKNGRVFRCLKFRTMVVDAEWRLAQLLAADPIARAEWNRDHKLRRDPRITLIGGFLRATSLDELPQLFNVLVGDMSLVGPRPIVPAEQVRYGRFYAHYCAVQPGITGLWQVSGRNDVSYRRRVACDVVYSRSVSLPLYFYILARTLPAVVFARGSY